MQDFVRALASFSPQGAAYWRARRRWSVAAVVISAYLAAVVVGLAALTLWTGWRTGVWGLAFLVSSATMLQIIGLWMPYLWCLRDELTARRSFGIAQNLRSAILDRTQIGLVETVEPLTQASTEPDSDPFSKRPAYEPKDEFGPFTSVAANDHAGLFGFGTTLVIVGVLLSALGVALVIFLPDDTLTDLNLLLVMVVFGALSVLGPPLIAFGIAMLAWAGQRRKPLWFVADDVGLRPRGAYPGDPGAIAWGEARAFWRTRATSEIRHIQFTLYVLDAGDRMLTWGRAAQRDNRAQLASDDLCQRITARTRLPMYDTTFVATQLTKWPPVSAKSLTRSPSTSHDGWGALVPARPRIMRAISLSGVALLLFVAVYAAAGGWALPHLQAAIYQRLVSRIHAEQPLYHSALATDDGGWLDNPSNTPNTSTSDTFSYPGAYTFRAGSYQLQTSSYDFLESLRNQVYGDVAVEVTMRMPDDRTPLDGAGLLLHQGSGGYVDAHQVAFTISGDGAWSANNFNLQGGSDTYETLDQHSSAIHTNAGALNTVLVLIRGHQFLFFVNGLYIGAYYDALSHPGYVGLFDNDSNTTVSFTNFTIYPAIETGW